MARLATIEKSTTNAPAQPGKDSPQFEAATSSDHFRSIIFTE